MSRQWTISPMRRLLTLAALCLCLVSPPETATAGPGSTTDLLTFIRALEAPRGYIDYERRIPIAPPAPLTRMTVGDVLAWQRRVRQSGAPSTAAGGYQIIYPTLSRLVRVHGIDPRARFGPAMQDHLAGLLIAECGPRGPVADHPRYGNCLAGIWAALPLTRGRSRGRSAHHGIAGNRALTRPETVLALLAGTPVTLPAGAGGHRARGPAPTGTRGRLAFGATTIASDPAPASAQAMTDTNAALRGAARQGTLTPSTRIWKLDPYATR